MAEEKQKQDADFITSRDLLGELRRYMPVARICDRTGVARTTLYMIQNAGGELKADQYIRALRLYAQAKAAEKKARELRAAIAELCGSHEQAKAAEEKAKELRMAVSELYGGSV